MNMHIIDWLIISVSILASLVVAFSLKKYIKSVSGFLVANRCAGRYLLTISQGSSAVGAITILGFFEMYYAAGFNPAWWMILTMPIGLLTALSGYIGYRYRETRVMTLAQLFEIRYSRRFRIFTGILAWSAGIINMGIFPAVTANFLIYFLGLPESFSFLGFNVSTFMIIMLIELSIALLVTFAGGMIVIMTTDFIYGVFCNVVFVVILVVLYLKFDWQQILDVAQSVPEDASLINPFKTGKAKGFNMSFFLMQAVCTFYALRAWQGIQGYNAAAKNAHEAKMGGIIGTWRLLVLGLLVMVVPICAYTFLHHNDFSQASESVKIAINAIENSQLQTQQTVPLAMLKILPVGVLGLFAAMMIGAAIGTDQAYLHSWGTIFIQDIVLPLRKKDITPQHHIRLLRISMLFVAAFVFTFSLYFKQSEHIIMFLSLTGAIFLGGAGSVIVGGLYWKRGSTNAAWGAMIVGGGLAFTGLILQQIWPGLITYLTLKQPDWQFLTKMGETFPLNGMQVNFLAMICAIVTYIGLSCWDWLVLKKPEFNMDRMLHRGIYAIKGEHIGNITKPATGIKAIMPTKEFTWFDKVIHFSLLVWIVFWVLLFIVVTLYHLTKGTTDQWWFGFWKFKVWITAIIGITTVVWIIIGGIKDMKDMLISVKNAHVDESDNGRVVEKQLN